MLSLGAPSLAYPSRAPGFDPSHPASFLMNGGSGFSAVAMSSGDFVNVLTGAPATKTGSSFPTPTMTPFGQSGLVDAVTKSVQLAGQATSTPSVLTFGALATFTGTGDGSFCPVVGFSTSGAIQFGMNGTGQKVYLFIAANGSNTSSFQISLNVPYFIAASMVSAGTIVFVATNLITGQILSSTTSTASTLQPAVANPTIGSDIGLAHYANAQIMAAMDNPNVFLSLAKLRAWAADPLPFWFPPNRAPWPQSLFFGKFTAPPPLPFMTSGAPLIFM